MGLFSKQHGVILIQSNVMNDYNTQFPDFMDNLFEPNIMPYIPSCYNKTIAELTDDDLKNMYIAGRFKK